MSVDSIGDFLTIIRNGVMVGKPSVVAPYSKARFAIAQLLREEGFIRDVQTLEPQTGKKQIKVVLKYVNGESVIHEVWRVSTPGRRVYEGCKNLKPVIGKLGVQILTTDRGIITDKQAKVYGIGGEILCAIW